MAKLSLRDALNTSLTRTKQYIDTELAKKANSSHGTHLTLGTGSGNAFRGDYGNTAYQHSQSAHAPSNAQKNSDITKAEIEAKLTGTVTSHNHSGTYAPATHNHTSLTGITSLTFDANSDDSSVIKITKDSSVSYTDFVMSDDAGTDAWRWRFKAWDSSTSSSTAEFNLMTLKATSTTKGQLSINGNVTADSFTENGTALSSKYAAASHGTHLTLGTGSGNAYRGDYGNTAYNHSQAAHAPSNAQKNSDITKTEIENKLTGTISSHTHDYITSMDTRSANSAPNTYTIRGIYPEFKSTSTVGLPNVGKNFAGVITYQQWGDTTSWSGGKATQFATLDDGRMYFRKGEGTSWGAWNRFYTNLHKPDLEELGAAPASHGTHLTIGTGANNAAAGNHTHKYAGSSSAGGAANNSEKFGGYSLWVGTQAQYDAISSKSSTTIYIIKS